MNNRPIHIVRLLTLVVGTALLQVAHAEDPEVFEREARVVEIKEVCDKKLPHCHQIKTKWDLEENKTTFKVMPRDARPKVYFFDLTGVSGNEMEAPNLHLINGDKNPLSRSKFSSLDKWPAKIDDFLFLFGIENLENADGTRTPHALIYVPYRKIKLGLDQDRIYRVYVVHIPETAAGCVPNEKVLIEQKLCTALVGLQKKWLDGASDKELNDQAQVDARYLLAHIFDGIGSPGTISLEGDPIALVFLWIYGFGLHNGIIHGNLGGG